MGPKIDVTERVKKFNFSSAYRHQDRAEQARPTTRGAERFAYACCLPVRACVRFGPLGVCRPAVINTGSKASGCFVALLSLLFAFAARPERERGSWDTSAATTRSQWSVAGRRFSRRFAVLQPQHQHRRPRPRPAPVQVRPASSLSLSLPLPGFPDPCTSFGWNQSPGARGRISSRPTPHCLYCLPCFVIIASSLF
jgi:hypothetical protein